MDVTIATEADPGALLEDPRWAWELANPVGLRLRVARVSGVDRARFAARGQRVLADGEERVFGCVLPPWPEPRAGGEVVGALREAARALLSETTGPSADLLSYGWLSDPALTWCLDELRFETPRVHTILVGQSGWSGDARADEPLPAGIEVLQAADPRVADLHRRCAAAWGVSGLRDEAFLRWRVFEHPSAPYTVLAARGAGDALAGHVVARESDLLGARALTLVDWLVPDDEPEAGEALLEAVRVLARRRGLVEVRATLPEWSGWFARLEELGFLVHASDLRLATRRNHPRHEIYWLRANWWVQPLDLDRV